MKNEFEQQTLIRKFTGEDGKPYGMSHMKVLIDGLEIYDDEFTVDDEEFATAYTEQLMEMKLVMTMHLQPETEEPRADSAPSIMEKGIKGTILDKNGQERLDS